MTRLPFNYDKWRTRSDYDDADEAEKERQRDEYLAERADYEADREKDEAPHTLVTICEIDETE